MGYLVIVESPDGTSREHRLVEGETSLGRDPANALLLEGRGVSRRHAKLVLTGDRLIIADLGSTYGTRVNDVTTLRRELVSGDEVSVGMHVLRVKGIPDTSVDNELPPAEVATDSWKSGYQSEEVTQSPDELVHMRTQEMAKSAIQFIVDGPEEAVSVVPRHDSDLISAVQRMGTKSLTPSAELSDMGSSEYRALLLMYRVSQLLADAADLQGFVNPVADLVLEEVRADTVVLLMVDGNGEVEPEVIRHQGSLSPGEVPVSRGIVDRVIRDQIAVMSDDVGHDSRIKAGQSVMLYKIHAVVALPLMVRGEIRGVLYVGRSGGKGFVSEDGDLLQALVSLIASGIERAELKERVVNEKQRRAALERFHPPEVVDRLFSHGTGEAALEEHKATVLVCDLQGFHGLVQRVPPRQLATVLHEYYELLYDKVFANGGSLVKLHDGWALALFGAPHSHDRDAAWAVESAISLCEEFGSLAVLWPESQSLALRCVIDTGQVVAGVVGSTERMEFTAIGLPISAAAAVVQEVQGTGIWLTERTWSELPQARRRVEELPPIGDQRVYRLQG